MGKAIEDQNGQVSYLKQRLSMFIEVLDNIDPEEAQLEDIDRLIDMLDDLEVKVEQFKKK